MRRNDATGELAYLRRYSPGPEPLRTLVRGRRIEESFQARQGPDRAFGIRRCCLGVNAMITKWWLSGLAAMAAAGMSIPSNSLALAAHDEGVNDAYSRTMVGLIALGDRYSACSAASRATLRRVLTLRVARICRVERGGSRGQRGA